MFQLCPLHKLELQLLLLTVLVGIASVPKHFKLMCIWLISTCGDNELAMLTHPGD